MNNFTYSDELYHYGVRGMRWGKHKKKEDYASESTSADEPERKKNIYNHQHSYEYNGKTYKPQSMKTWGSNDADTRRKIIRLNELRQRRKLPKDSNAIQEIIRITELKQQRKKKSK